VGRSFMPLDLDEDVWGYVKARAAVHHVSAELFLAAILEQHVNRRRSARHAEDDSDLWADTAPATGGGVEAAGLIPAEVLAAAIDRVAALAGIDPTILRERIASERGTDPGDDTPAS
jgi:plasmid stability protein